MCLRRMCVVRIRCNAFLLLPLVFVAFILIILRGFEDQMEDAEAISRLLDLRIEDELVTVSRNMDYQRTMIKDPKIEEPRNMDRWNMDQGITEEKVVENRNVEYRITEPRIMDYRNIYHSHTYPNIMEPMKMYSRNKDQKKTEERATDYTNKDKKIAEPKNFDPRNKEQKITEPRNMNRRIKNSNITQPRTTDVPLVQFDPGSVPSLDAHLWNHLEPSEPTVLESFIAENVKLQGIVPPLHPKKIRSDWQMVNASHDIFLYSAYLDDRSNLYKPSVRLIGVADTRTNTSDDALYCLLWYSSKNTPEVTSIEMKSVGPDIRLSDGRVFGQYVLSCRAPEGTQVPMGTRIPRNVSVVTSYNIHPSNVLEVQIPLKPVDPSEVIEFGHCMSIVYWQRDPLRLVEWLELHRIWGVGEVNVYGHSLDNDTLAVLRHYDRTGFVRFREVSTVVEEEGEWPILLNMSPVLNDCLYRNLYRYRYIVCTDFDEMIVPRGTHRTYRDMVDSATTKVYSTSGSKFPIKSFAFRNVYFFLDFGPVLPDPWYLTTTRYQTRVHPSRYGYSFKSITRTLDCLGLQNHYCWEPLDGGKNHPGWNVDVDVETGMNHHYKKCHFDRYLHQDGLCLRLMVTSFRDRTMERFREELETRVPEVLVELDLVDARPIETSTEALLT